MSVASLSSAGGATLSIGYAGQIANPEEYSAFSLDNESTSGGLTILGQAGGIDFGIAVARGTKAGCCKIIAADTDLPIGITVRSPTMVTDTAGVIGYRSSSTVSIAYLGDIYATAYEAVAAGDEVLSVTAQGGALSGNKAGLAGSGRVKVPGAHWVNAVAAGAVGLVRMTGINNPRTTT